MSNDCLSPKQLMLLEMLLQPAPMTKVEIAKKLKVDQVTVQAWMKTPAFQREYDQRVDDLLTNTGNQVLVFGAQALGFLSSVLSDPNATINEKIKAAGELRRGLDAGMSRLESVKARKQTGVFDADFESLERAILAAIESKT